VFLFNSVIIRIEVKSILKKSEINKFIKASYELSKLRFTVSTPHNYPIMGPFNMLFAFESNLRSSKKNPEKDLDRIQNVMREESVKTDSGIVSTVCIPGKGLWKIAKDQSKIRWQKLISNSPLDHMAWWVACISSSCFQQHAIRQGRDPKLGIEGGVGKFIPGGSDIWAWI
jgi:hypothetical protein